MSVLHAWISGEYVGYFEQQAMANHTVFRCDRDAAHDVSVSFLRDHVGTRQAPQNFLEGLVPESPAARTNMRLATGAVSNKSWDLLEAVKGDLAGAVFLHPSMSNQVQEMQPFTRFAAEEAVAARIASIQSGGTGLEQMFGVPRFSLAGVQDKFAFTEVNGDLYWSDAATASTHIIKPASPEHHGLDEAEAASLELARRIGLDSAEGLVRSFAGYRALVVKRFDRRFDETGVIRRIHMEDVGQALGRHPQQKYMIAVKDVVNLLRRLGADESVPYEFIKQLAFNVAIGNADAHAKNYSLMHEPQGVTMSPLYDTVPTGFFPEYSQRLSMRIGSAKSAVEVSRDDWVKLAQQSGLFAERVLYHVREVDRRFLEHAEATLGVTERGRSHRGVLDRLMKRAERTQVG